MAERLLRNTLASGVLVASAGTRAVVGRPIEPPMDRFLAEVGVEAGGFTSRMLDVATLQRADLILTMTDEHVGDVIELWPRAVRRTFTLRGFARLLGQVEVSDLTGVTTSERLSSAIPLVLAARRMRPDPTSDDVVDPYGQPDHVFRLAFTAIAEAVDSIGARAQPDEGRRGGPAGRPTGQVGPEEGDQRSSSCGRPAGRPSEQSQP